MQELSIFGLAFLPTDVTVNGVALTLRSDLNAEGYTVRELGGGDYAVSIGRARSGDVTVSAGAVTTYMITASAGTGGTINPSGTVTVSQGATQTFSFAAGTGYVVAAVIVDGVSIGAAGSYTFADVTANHTIAVSFSQNTGTVPAAPLLLSPANGAAGQSTSPTLSWSASAGAASYRCQVSTSSSFTTTVVDDSTLTGTSKAVSGLSAGLTYYWRVNASNANGTSAWSATWNFATQQQEASGGIIGYNGAGSTIDYISDASGSYINLTRFQATANLNVTAIYAKVLGITGAYKCAIYSDNNGTPRDLLKASGEVTNPSTGWQTFSLPSAQTITAGQYYWLAVWSSLRSTSAGVYCEPTGSTTRWTNALTYGTWPNPVATFGGSNYKYCIYASDPGTAPPPAPATPLLLSPANGAAGQSTSPTLSWSASAGAASYRCQVSTSSSFTTTVVDDSTLTGTSKAVSGLAAGLTYYWRVNASNANGTSAWSATWNFATQQQEASGGIIGYNGAGSTTDYISDASGSYINLTRFQATANLNVTTIYAKVRGITGAYQCAIYSDNNGTPRDLLKASGEVANPSTGWQTFSLPSAQTITAGQYYWLAVWSSLRSTSAGVYCEPTGSTTRWTNALTYGTWPNQVTTTGGGNYKYCIYAR